MVTSMGQLRNGAGNAILFCLLYVLFLGSFTTTNCYANHHADNCPVLAQAQLRRGFDGILHHNVFFGGPYHQVSDRLTSLLLGGY